MAKGFVNLNRFKHGRALKRNSKQGTAPQANRKMTRRGTKFGGQANELAGPIRKVAAVNHIACRGTNLS